MCELTSQQSPLCPQHKGTVDTCHICAKITPATGNWNMATMNNDDQKRVVLIKSLRTKNRFYTMVHPSRGIRNADTVPDIPPDLNLGIAYPCLEDGLNDFAVIRTTFETLDLFAEDDPLRSEMMEIVDDARGNLMRRLEELRERIAAQKAFFLGTDYEEFKSYVVNMVQRGQQRRTLDSMMKLDVFSSVAEAEGFSDPNDLPYQYEFNAGVDLQTLMSYPPSPFIVAVLQDVLNSVQDDNNYRRKYLFDRNVFQKFIAVMFVNYATTDPMFYGINRHDYGVSGDKVMDDTPLYIAIRKELVELEKRQGDTVPAAAPQPPALPLPAQPAVQVHPAFIEAPEGADMQHPGVSLPNELVHEEILLGPIMSLCAAAQILKKKQDPETQRMARMVLVEAGKLVDELKRIGILSPIANNPARQDTQ